MVNKSNISLIGVPSDVGAGDRGAIMGPEALRVARIKQTLEELGLSVTDKGNLTGSQSPEAPPVNGYRHLEQNIDWCHKVKQALLLELDKGQLPIMMGGDHALSIGSLAAISEYCDQKNINLCVLWIDAHADFNTSNTSPSGNVHGMPVAVAAGLGHAELLDVSAKRPMIHPNNIYQVGIRSVDHEEKKLVKKHGLIVYDMRRIDEIGMRAAMTEILEDIKQKDAYIHVSFDVDSLDPTIAPGVGTTIPGGLTYREAQLCMEMVHDSGRMISMDITEINPALDDKNKTAELAVDLTASLFGRQIFPSNL